MTSQVNPRPPEDYIEFTFDPDDWSFEKRNYYVLPKIISSESSEGFNSEGPQDSSREDMEAQLIYHA